MNSDQPAVQNMEHVDMVDVDETAARLGEMLAKATSLPWRLGRGHNGLSVSALSGKKMQIATSSWHSCSEYYPTHQSTLDNFALIVAAINALPALLSERAAMKEEIETLRAAQQWREIESAPRDGTPIEVRVNWLWNGGRGDEVELIDIAHFDSSVSNWVFVTAPNYFQQLDRRCTITLWRPLQAHTVTGDKQ